MEKSKSNEDVDQRIRLVREVSEQPTVVSEEHLDDLLQKDQGESISTESIRSRFHDTIIAIVKLEAEYRRKIGELEEAMELAEKNAK